MKKKRRTVKSVAAAILLVALLLSTGVLLTGCGKEEPFLQSSRERNILKEEYDADYNHYEDTLNVENADFIRVTGRVTSGTIYLTVMEKEGDGGAAATEIYEYEITDTLDETIDLEKDHREEWVAVVDFDEDAEGHYAVEIYG